MAATGPSVITRPSAYTLTAGSRAAVTAGVTKPPVYSTRRTSPDAAGAGSASPSASPAGARSAHAVSVNSNADARTAEILMPLGRGRTPIGSTPVDVGSRTTGSVGARASGHRPLLRGLHRTAHRPPADGDEAAAGQGRRLGVHPRRRPRLQAAELDEPALHAEGRARRRGRYLDGHQQGRRAADHHHRVGRPRPLPGTRRRPRAAEGRRGGRAAAAA